MLVCFSPNFAPCNKKVCGQPTPVRGGGVFSWKAGYTELCPCWQKRVLSTSPQYASVLTSEQLKRQSSTSFSAALYAQSFNPFAFIRSAQILNTWETPEAFSAFLCIFCYLSFCLKTFGRSVKNVLHCTIQNHREMVQQQQKNSTKIHGGNFHPNNGMMSPFSPISKDMQTYS